MKSDINKYALWTIDVETTSIWYNSLQDEMGRKVLEDGLPRLLELLQNYDIKSTFFVTGYIARLYPQIVRLISDDGHEIASHGKSHLKRNGFDVMELKKQIKHLHESKQILEDISGMEVISFRAPALRVSQNTVIALLETGYRIDSSIASQRFDFFLSFGGLNKLKWLVTSRCPYRTDETNIFKKGSSSLIEIPLSAMVFPYLGTTMRIFPRISNITRGMLRKETSLHHKPIVFDIHPNELIDEAGDNRKIERRTKNIISYLLSDLLRSKLKTKNLGDKALMLFKDQIEYFRQWNFTSTTLRDYCIKRGWIENLDYNNG